MFDLWILVKLAFLFVIILYLVFAGVVVRQVYLMITTIQTGFDFPIKALSWLHLFLAVGVLLLAIIVL